jgi:hypothetical protein
LPSKVLVFNFLTPGDADPRPAVAFASIGLPGPEFFLVRLVAGGPAPGWALFLLSSGTSIKVHTFYLKKLDSITK